MQQAMNGLNGFLNLLPTTSTNSNININNISSNTPIAKSPISKLQPVPENGDVDNDSNASQPSSSSSSNNSQTQQTLQLPQQNNNGYITTNIIQPNQLLHTPKDFNSDPQSPMSPQQQQLLLQSLQRSNSLPTQFPLPPSLQEIQQMSSEGIQSTLQRTNSMPDLLSNPPPHPSQFSRSYGQLPLTNNASMPFLFQKPPQTYLTTNGIPIPLLPNILDQNQIALQLQNVVNQNIVNANILQQQQQHQPQTSPVVTPSSPSDQTQTNTNNTNTTNTTPTATTPTTTTTTTTTTATTNNDSQQISIAPQQIQSINGHQPTISATPTLLNVAEGVIPGVEAGLYWYHPQIDQSAVLLPVVVNEAQQQQQQQQQQVALAYQNAMQQIAIQQQNQLVQQQQRQ